MYLACAREMYSDYENNKPATLEAALDRTVERWLARGFEPDLVKRIRSKVTETYDAFKRSTPEPPKLPVPEQVTVEEEDKEGIPNT
jgi:hypothetical protein